MGIENSQEWNVVVGRVASTWDRALLKVQPFSDNPRRFDAGRQIRIGTAAAPVTIVSSRPTGHALILDCGLESSAQAAALVGCELTIHPSMRAALPPGEFYTDQLMGLRVMTEAGDDLGCIEEILDAKVHDVYVTPCAMIPGVDEFVIKRDFENGVVLVRDIPGLRTDS